MGNSRPLPAGRSMDLDARDRRARRNGERGHDAHGAALAGESPRVKHGTRMKGNNTLTLCPLQMQIIVQEWIDRNLVTKPMVTSVTGERDGFEVHLSEPQSEKADAP